MKAIPPRTCLAFLLPSLINVLDKRAKIVPEMEELVNYLRARGWRVVIVTASPKWIIEPGALRLGLCRDDVLGIEVSSTTPV